MANFYDLTANYVALLELAQDEEADEQAIKDTMEALEGEIEDKADALAGVMRTLRNNEDELDAEIKRLTARKTAIENNRKRILAMLQLFMESTGKTKFKTAKNSFWVQTNAPSVKLDIAPENVPERFKVQKPAEVSLTLIKKAIEAGEVIEFAHMESTSSVRFR